MRNRDGRVVALEEGVQGLVDERLALRIEGRRGFVQDEDVRILEQCARNGDALFLAA